jgi:hypothetical protein
MSARPTWHAWCASERFEVHGDRVTVRFSSGRRHRVRVREEETQYVFEAVVARPTAAQDIPDLALRLWRWNRAAQRVGCYLAPNGGVRATGWIPRGAGADPEEFRDALERVAAEADRLEHLLTGRDAL